MQRLVQIVSRFWPVIDGIGDFARQLGAEIEERCLVESRFLVTDRGESSDPGISFLQERSASALAAALEGFEPDLVLLHYSGYGYQARGIPGWLVNGLEEFCSRRPRRLSVFFHEIWASGPPWKSEFYLQGVQKRLVFHLRRLARAGFTSTPRMQRLLGKSGKEVAVVPIPSTIGWSRAAVRNANSAVRLIVFGQEHSRARTLKAHGSLLRHLAAQGHLEQLVIVGKDAKAAEARKLGSGVLRRTMACADAGRGMVSECLSSADALLSFYPSNLLTKSSTAMAAFACGCPVILPREWIEDQFAPRPPFMVCDGSTKQMRSLLEARRQGLWDEVGRNALAWSEKHASWDSTIRHFKAALGLSTRTELTKAAA
jgi:hypothetical protein